MIERQSVLALVTARGGSKGLFRKNLRKVGGKTLLHRAIEAAQQADTIDRVILSSEDPEIIAAALVAGCDVPFVRPPNLAADDTKSLDVVRHALTALSETYDLVVLVQPTSPLRTGADIDAAVRTCVEHGAPACISVTATKPPHWNYYLDADNRLQPVLGKQPSITRRQDLPRAVSVNGAVFVGRCDWIGDRHQFESPETVAYLMPKERSIDIDDELDLIVADALARTVDQASLVNGGAASSHVVVYQAAIRARS